MKQHNQTVFLIEGMQSNWLTNRGHRWAYLLGFSLVFGFLVAQINEIGWYAWGIVSPDVAKPLADEIGLWVWVVGFTAWVLSIGIIDLFTFDRRVKPVQAQTTIVTRQAIINILIYGFTWFAIWAIIASAWNLWKEVPLAYPPNTGRSMSALILPAISGLITVLAFGMAGSKHSFTRDIRTTEAVSWSWTDVSKGCLWGFAGGVLVWLAWLIFWPKPDFTTYPGIVFLLAFMIIGVETCAILNGLHYRILETKTVPNEGIILSMKNVLKVGFLCWVIYALTMWGIFVLSRPDYTLFGADYNFLGGNLKGECFSFFCGLTFFSLSALYLGGLDLLKHYILRSILYLTGQTPRRYAHFLDHASRLNFLQKVGGGYIFIHRLLLEHFGAMCETEKDNTGEQP